MFRDFVLIVVIYPLLMSPGMCLCEAVNRDDGGSCFCNDECAVTDSASCIERASTAYCLCHGRHHVPTDKQCPPSCPGNQATDHSKVVGPNRSMLVSAAAINLVSYCVDLRSQQRIHTAASPVQPSAQPIYITLCTLVI